MKFSARGNTSFEDDLRQRFEAVVRKAVETLVRGRKQPKQLEAGGVEEPRRIHPKELEEGPTARQFKEDTMTYEQVIARAQEDYDQLSQRTRMDSTFSEFFETNRSFYESETLGAEPTLKFTEETTSAEAAEAFAELRRHGHLHDDDKDLFIDFFQEETARV